MSTLIQVEPKRCPACSGSVQPPDPRLRERPAWERWREVLRYPVKGGAWRITAISGLLLWFASLSVYFVPLYLMALILFVHAFGTCQQLWDTRELHLVSLDYGGETREVGAIDINIDQDLVA